MKSNALLFAFIIGLFLSGSVFAYGFAVSHRQLNFGNVAENSNASQYITVWSNSPNPIIYKIEKNNSLYKTYFVDRAGFCILEPTRDYLVAFWSKYFNWNSTTIANYIDRLNQRLCQEIETDTFTISSAKSAQIKVMAMPQNCTRGYHKDYLSFKPVIDTINGTVSIGVGAMLITEVNVMADPSLVCPENPTES